MKNAVSAEPVRLQIALPKKTPLQLTGALALSPDGRQLAFVASGADGIPRIWIRALNSLEMRPLPGTESVSSLLFWKPDGRFIAFNSGGKLRKIDISGGPAETVCSLNLTGVGGSWNADGVILFGQFGGPIMRVSAAGGVAMPVTVLIRIARRGRAYGAAVSPRWETLHLRARSGRGCSHLGGLARYKARGAGFQKTRSGKSRRRIRPIFGPRLRAVAFPARTDADGATIRRPPPQDFPETRSELWKNRWQSIGTQAPSPFPPTERWLTGRPEMWKASSPGSTRKAMSWAQWGVRVPTSTSLFRRTGREPSCPGLEADPDVLSPWMVDMSRGTSARV